MIKVKICGLTNVQDALQCCEAGVDALGFIFATSPRQMTPREVKKIIEELPPFVTTVGVFVNEELTRIKEIVEECQLDLVQLSGNEEPAYCQTFPPRKVIKAFRVKDEESLKVIPNYRVGAYLLDSFSKGIFGGSGKKFDWRLAKKVSQYGKVIIAGGLSPENVLLALREAQPYGVDVCSGVEETPGKKDYQKVRAFIAQVRRFESEVT
jgi:phosphoribosylanthranilate isomerase